jgi:uncharacterized membrane protein YfcA
VIDILVIAAAAFVAGIINSIAGGGTLLSFPALIWIGRSAVVANATNTVAVWPASVAGAFGFRRDIATLDRWLFLLTIPSLGGGMAGAILLLRTPEKVFIRIVPLLILGATILLAAQEPIAKRLQMFAAAHERRTTGGMIFAFVFQFFVSVYGGYFGAGMGILMLAALGLIGLRDLHQMNGLKNLLAICINGVAAVYFALSHAVVWRDAGVMAVTSILGGYLAARVARRLGRRFVRGFVIAIGLLMTIALAIRH